MTRICLLLNNPFNNGSNFFDSARFDPPSIVYKYQQRTEALSLFSRSLLNLDLCFWMCKLADSLVPHDAVRCCSGLSLTFHMLDDYRAFPVQSCAVCTSLSCCPRSGCRGSETCAVTAVAV